jgi:hypothetical protein
VTEFPDTLYPGNVRHANAGQLFEGIKKTVGEGGTIRYLELNGHGGRDHFKIGASGFRGGDRVLSSRFATTIASGNAEYIADQFAQFKYDKGAVIIFSGCGCGGKSNQSWLQLIANRTGAEVRAPTSEVSGWSINGLLQRSPGWKIYKPQ